MRRLREAAAMSQGQLGERVFCSGSYIGMFEAAERRPQLDMSRVFDELLGSGEHLQRLCRLARTSRVAGYFADAAELQMRATSISEFAPMLVPGLLQTEAYARALTRASHPFAAADVVDGHVRARRERARLLDAPAAPVLWVILHEAALRVPVGGAVVMAEQLGHLARRARSLPGVVLQVLPFSAGVHPLLNTSVTLMRFGDAPGAVYTETAYSGELIDDAAVVDRFHTAYDLARAAALSTEASLDLVESAEKDHATDTHGT
ncbi:Scr1 family TA system antitoxin-like transcriptional regulator [Streptomyces sp. NPDC057428]|uniref:helix-turn-helix domain-containing protein n=1 Tax=Streptomyces sp. NPDC057428 TaxID=3346129 RepID=UPI0036CDE9BA